jgi:hypothetical protein
MPLKSGANPKIGWRAAALGFHEKPYWLYQWNASFWVRHKKKNMYLHNRYMEYKEEEFDFEEVDFQYQKLA